MQYPFDFDINKGIETILYIAQNITEPTFLHICIISYLADKLHLQRYGRFISGDSYIAMKHSPVPNNIYNLLKIARNDPSIYLFPFGLKKQIDNAFTIHGSHDIYRLREANHDYFSDSDLKCLDEIIKQYGNSSFLELTRLSCDEAWKSAEQDDFIKIEDIVATLENANDLLGHLQDQFPDQADKCKEYLLEEV